MHLMTAINHNYQLFSINWTHN